jgi:EipB-like
MLAVLTGALALASTLHAEASAAPDGVALAPHRAIYELSLATTRGGSGVSSVAGRMAYDLTGSACEGYTQTMRFVTRMTNQSGNTVVTDLRSTTWEDARGKRFRFDSSQYRDEKATESTVGDAARIGASEEIKVELTKPSKKNISIPARAYFPVQHTIALLNAAKATKSSFRADLYDGSEKGEKVYDTVTAIGRVQAPGGNRHLPQIKNAARLDTLKGWPVSIAYFEPGSGRQDALPVYELSFVMFENGVSRKLYIDYGEFALEGDLSEITFYPPSKCDSK